MLFSKVKDNKIRQIYLQFEYKRRAKKFVFTNILSNSLNLSNKSFYKNENLYKSLYLKFNIKKYCFKNKIVNHCLINNKTKSVYKKFNLSRSILRDLMLFGLIPGYKKAVW
jgi:ribosomal protein S14